MLSNLLTNAERRSTDSRIIRIAAARKEFHVGFSVADRGRGIATDELPRLFSNFANLMDETEGGVSEAPSASDNRSAKVSWRPIAAGSGRRANDRVWATYSRSSCPRVKANLRLAHPIAQGLRAVMLKRERDSTRNGFWLWTTAPSF